MHKHHRPWIIGFNLVGLTLISTAEAIRPGFVGGAVNIGLIWVAVLVSLLWFKYDDS